MDSNVIKGKWKQLVGGMKQKWANLTEDDWKHVEGDKNKLIGRIQERYGHAKERAQREVDDYFKEQEGKQERKIS